MESGPSAHCHVPADSAGGAATRPGAVPWVTRDAGPMFPGGKNTEGPDSTGQQVIWGPLNFNHVLGQLGQITRFEYCIKYVFYRAQALAANCH